MLKRMVVGLARIVGGSSERETELAAALHEAREANTQLSEALNGSEARRRELEALLEAPAESEYTAWDDLFEEADTWATANVHTFPEASRKVAAIVKIAGQLRERTLLFRNALDRDQTGLAAALARVMRVAQGYWWVTEGRGSYEWNDDRYREETSRALSQVADLAKDALRASGTLATRAIRDFELRAGLPVPVEAIIRGMLIDPRRVEDVLRKKWAAVAGGSLGPFFPASITFDQLDEHQRQGAVHAIEVVLEAVLEAAAPSDTPEPWLRVPRRGPEE